MSFITPHALSLLAQVCSSKSSFKITYSPILVYWLARVISVTRSRVSWFGLQKCPAMPADPWGRSLISFHFQYFHHHMLDYDFSSKLCFEENSSFHFVINCHVIFKSFWVAEFSKHNPGLPLSIHATIPAKISKRKHHSSQKNQGGNKQTELY